MESLAIYMTVVFLLQLWIHIRIRRMRRELDEKRQAPLPENIVRLADHQANKVSTRKIIKNLAEHDPQGIIAFAWWDSGEMTVHFSGGMDKMRVVGALERAKHEVING